MSTPQRIVGIIVARMGSTRVPGKAVLDLCGEPVLWHVIESVKRAHSLAAVCLATSDLAQDEPLARLAERAGIPAYRGDPERVLDRVHGAARMMAAEAIVEVGGDCPFIHPELLDDAVSEFRRLGCDYLCNYEPPTFPEGLDINVVGMRALAIAHARAIAPSQRIHPFSYLTRHRADFDIKNYAMAPDLSEYHWSIDFPEDVAFVQAVYARLYRHGESIPMSAVLDLIGQNPEVGAQNRRLMKPKVLHAFWNSPGIMRDMNSDVIALIGMAQKATAATDPAAAARCYAEAEAIVAELRRHTEHRASNP